MENVYEYISEVLESVFEIKRRIFTQNEITMYEFLDYFREAKRRGLENYGNKIVEISNLFIYEYYMDNSKSYHFKFEEKIIPKTKTEKNAIYDEEFIKELLNIELHSNNTEYQGNLVHYIISSRSIEAACDMTETLAQSLVKANRINGRRMEVISEIEPDLYGLGCVTAIREAFLAAKGGVLFIDEAYSMVSDTAVTVLIQEMENRRDDVIVILAGYNERMHDFMKINEGLKSRIPHWIDFPDYTADELTDIFKLMIRERGFRVTDEAIKEAHYIFEKARNTDNFGNGRYVRNLIDRASQNQAVRLLSDGKDASVIKKDELFRITKNDISMLEEGLKKERKPGTAKKELDNMIGLASVKEVIHKSIAHYKLNKLCIDKGIAREKASLHMVFTGNPGTAKTTVARLFAEIMKDEKVLSTETFVEVGRADLVGDHVGSTAPLVKKKFKEAQGGVQFIDEAYALCDSYENGFGDEAINTLVQEMENHKDDVIVIFAGYTEPMHRFLDINPGMLSRIAFQVKFEDYTTDELCDIAREESDYGNGRFVRKILEEAEMNLAERILQFKESAITTELITTIEECDIPDFSTRNKSIRQIGFAC